MAAVYTYSEESTHVRRSVLRELLAHAVDPNIISLATGLPSSQLLPVERFNECVNTVVSRDGARALQYSPQFVPLREWIADYMTRRGVKSTPDNILITNGCQHGLTLMSRLFLNPGDTAVVEQVTFIGIEHATGGRGATLRPIPSDLDTGADMDALEAAFKQEPHPKLAIIIPDFHNPLGISITPEKRQRAAQLANTYGIPLVEDDPYSPLRFIGDIPQPIKSYDTDGFVFYLGSFSKILAPGVRCGWIVGPSEVIRNLERLREAHDLETSTLIQRSITEFLSRGWLEEHLTQLNAANHLRRDTLLAALDNHLGQYATWTEPEGGIFIWVTLPEQIDTWDMIKEAIDNKVVYIPGGEFSVVGGYRNTMRLNFSNVANDKIAEGIQRLAAVIEKRL
ncbi:MAG: aminotransferase [Anaerolineaceae bacterium]|nr:aminotransferase [Anaerolineaceae bacterium]